MDNVYIGNLKIDNVTMEQAVERCVTLAKTGGGAVYTPNAEMAKDALDDASFMEILNNGDLVVADGVGVVLASKILGTPLKGKVAGCDLAQNLLPKLETDGLSLFLFGAKPGVAEGARDEILKRHPNIKIAGIADGYYKEDEERLSLIRGADVCFVCLGVPKQEHFINTHAKKEGILMLGLGGTLDVLAGTVKRAPDIFIKLNLEWLYRVAFDPKRWRRSLKLPAFVIEVLKLKGGRK